MNLFRSGFHMKAQHVAKQLINIPWRHFLFLGSDTSLRAVALIQNLWSTTTRDPAEPSRRGRTGDVGHDFTSSPSPQNPAVVSKRRVTLAGSDRAVFWLPWKQSLAWRKPEIWNQSTSEQSLPAKNNRIRTVPVLLLIRGLMLSNERQKQSLAAMTPLINWIVWRLTAGHERCVLKSLHRETASGVWLTRCPTPEKLMDFSLIS